MDTIKIKKHLHERVTEDIKSISHLDGIDHLTAKDAMIHPVFLQKHDTTQTILKKLRQEDISACIVVTTEKKFIWEVSVEDIIKLFVQQINTEPMIKYLTRGYKKWFLYKNAGELCNKHTYIVHEDTNINTVIKHIYNPLFMYIPVVNKKKQVIGVITPNSLINLLKDH